MKNAYNILIGKPEGKRPHGRAGHTWEDDIKIELRSRDSSVGIALGYGLDDRSSRFDSRRRLGIFLLTTAFRPALVPTKGLFPCG
jgi:hypothetical protein